MMIRTGRDCESKATIIDKTLAYRDIVLPCDKVQRMDAISLLLRVGNAIAVIEHDRFRAMDESGFHFAS